MQSIVNTLKEIWGYTDFRPLQQEAMAAVKAGRDTLVILPTGGGKSLCYQVPAVILPGLTVVVSPLISLMKDQVDALNECGVMAARIDSSLTPDQRRRVFNGIHSGSIKLLYVAPERLMMDGFLNMIKQAGLSFIAIDEAHCISMWGHDFRPEFRQLGRIKEIFPQVPVGAYTATATNQVRRDIAEQLHLNDPQVLIGSFDRPNLIYKVFPRQSVVDQVVAVLQRHPKESGIIYCIRRVDVDQMSAALIQRGIRAVSYHAGMSDELRKKHQDDFVQENVDIVVATVAFGMGIDKSNVRFVIHTGMPKSLEHYQQESGRAGRDGLEAECVLFYSGADYGIWKNLTRDMPDQARRIALEKIGSMYNYCTTGLCRHQVLLHYFGQRLDKDNCSACDVCLGEVDTVPQAPVVAQKILSCVLRLDQRFGSQYTAQVLTGSRDRRILAAGHDTLSTYGLLGDYPIVQVQNWTEQLIGQGHLEKSGEYNTLSVTPSGWQVLRGQVKPRLVQPALKPRTKRRLTQVGEDQWDGVDRGLFEALREKRAQIAQQKRVPAFVVFGDAALRDMARKRPTTPDRFLEVRGVGQAKARQYGRTMLETITNYCRDYDLDTDEYV